MSKPSDIQYANDFLKHIVPYVSEEQVKFWVETENIDYVEILTLIANNEMTRETLHAEIFNNPEWDPTEE